MGASFHFNKAKCVFVNTCPVNNWLALFCSLSYENPKKFTRSLSEKIWELAVIYYSFEIGTEMSIRNGQVQISKNK